MIVLACSPATTPLVTPRLLTEVAASADEFDRAPTAERLEHAMDLMRRMHDTRPIRPFRAIAEVSTFHDDTAAQYQDFLERHGQSRGIADLPTYELIQSLKSDNFTIAIVGEFSRGNDFGG